MRKLILRNCQSPGDIVMLTAAVRDLHRTYRGEFETDVRTPCPDLWENNPYLTPFSEEDPEVEPIDCQYPLIHRSNEAPYHFIHGFIEHLNERLGVGIRPAGSMATFTSRISKRVGIRRSKRLSVARSRSGSSSPAERTITRRNGGSMIDTSG